MSSIDTNKLYKQLDVIDRKIVYLEEKINKLKYFYDTFTKMGDYSDELLRQLRNLITDFNEALNRLKRLNRLIKNNASVEYIKLNIKIKDDFGQLETDVQAVKNKVV